MALAGERIARFLLLLVFVGGIVLLIWWACATGRIKHVDSVPLPPTAPVQRDRRRSRRSQCNLKARIGVHGGEDGEYFRGSDRKFEGTRA
jgi:hypothetical protein